MASLAVRKLQDEKADSFSGDDDQRIHPGDLRSEEAQSAFVRIPKPRKQVLLRARYYFMEHLSGRIKTYSLILTRDVLWLSPSIAIPLQNVHGVGLINVRQHVEVLFDDELGNPRELMIGGIGLLGPSPKASHTIFRKTSDAWQAVRKAAREEG